LLCSHSLGGIMEKLLGLQNIDRKSAIITNL